MSAESSAWLECRTTGKRLVLDDFAVVGRGPTVRVRVEDAGVSREHASLRRKDGGWWVQDMGSANGTFVNGLPATLSTRIRDGDELSFGPARYVFRDARAGKAAEEDRMEMTIVARPGSDLAKVTMLVADVIGFSELSTRYAPAEIGRAMSAWCEHCRNVLNECGGHIDKFIGDCVFAWWHGSSPEVKARALKAAQVLASEFEGSRLPDGTGLACGISLHSGEASLSRLGPSSYTLLGSDVNLAFRIESLTRRLERILASQAFAGGWPDPCEWSFPPLGLHDVKGWHQPIGVCGVRGVPAA